MANNKIWISVPTRAEHRDPASSNSEEPGSSTTQYSQSSPNNQLIHILHSLRSTTIARLPATPISPSDVHSHNSSRSPSDIPLNNSTMRVLLRPYGQDIVDQVVLQLTSNNHNPHSPAPLHAQQVPRPTQGPQPQQPNSTNSRIALVESQLAIIRKQGEQGLADMREPRDLSMYDQSQPLFPHRVRGHPQLQYQWKYYSQESKVVPCYRLSKIGST